MTPKWSCSIACCQGSRCMSFQHRSIEREGGREGGRDKGNRQSDPNTVSLHHLIFNIPLNTTRSLNAFNTSSPFISSSILSLPFPSISFSIFHSFYCNAAAALSYLILSCPADLSQSLFQVCRKVTVASVHTVKPLQEQ